MIKYIFQRILLIFVTIFIILSLSFVLIKSLKAYPPASNKQAVYTYYQNQVNSGYYEAHNIINIDDKNFDSSKYDYVYESDDKSVVIGYNTVPILQQYVVWLGRVFTKWDWGTTTQVALNTPAFEYLASRIPPTLKLNLVSLIVSVPLGFALGILAALRKNKLTDHIIMILVMIFISVPSFIVMTLLMLGPGYMWQWVPTQWPSASSQGKQVVLGYVLPVLALSFGSIAGLARNMRAELTEVMTSDFLLLARTKGLTRRQTIMRHALRNSMVPIIPLVIGSFVSILSGSMVIEQLYGIPGVGKVFVTAIGIGSKPDYDLVMVDLAFYTIISLFAILVVDLSYGIIDPRIRMGGKK